MSNEHALADEIERAIEAFHDALPQGQGEIGDGGVAGRAMCQLFYDNSETIVAALRSQPVRSQPVEAGPHNLNQTHVRLLGRGIRSKWIGLSDNAGVRVGEIKALGELERAGLVQASTDELPPGPPTTRPREITEAGRQALAAHQEHSNEE